MTDPSEYLPLQEPTFYILLSLAPGKKHGYAILKEVEDLSGGSLRLSTGTLYGALSRLMDQGLIEHVGKGEAVGAHPGKPRKAYRLTETGALVLAAERQRLHALLAAARRLLGEEGGGRAARGR